jgi:hypothetical protein
MKIPALSGSAAAFAFCLLAGSAQAASYTNIAGNVIEFPDGDASFADSLISLSGGLVTDPDGETNPVTHLPLFPPGTTVPLPFTRNGNMALGVPDVTNSSSVTCGTSVLLGGNFNWVPGCNFVSLGVGGSLTVQFTDNALHGNGDPTQDLYIFEIGPDIEDTFVDVSKNGIDWTNVGKVGGSTSGVDIDTYGFHAQDLFNYVRLTDDPNEGNTDGSTVGADIDAIGANPVGVGAVPLPAAGWLGLTAFLALGRWSRIRRR